MDRKTIGIVVLSVTATLLVGMHLISTPTASAEMAVSGRDYQAVTAKAQGGGEALYILDNKTGQMAVFLYDTRDKTVRVRDVRMVRDAFAGR
ncbi:MAG TPA: hypothetical protein VHP11_00440 [Tepidisphaeraceae bacterium]|nr:hypothetical protein [Tepidisphaeraceae bacterium]